MTKFHARSFPVGATKLISFTFNASVFEELFESSSNTDVVIPLVQYLERLRLIETHCLLQLPGLNLCVDLRGIDPGMAPSRSVRSRKRTYAFLFRSMRTLRVLVIARAGGVVRIGGRTRLRLVQNPGVQQLYERLDGSASL